MEKFLLIASILSLHYPMGLFKDTTRRYNRMQSFGKNMEYKIQNGVTNDSNPIFGFPISLIAIIASFIFAYFPLKELLELSWFWIILINFLITLIIGPTLAFVTTPGMTILYKDQLIKRTIIFTILGIILYGVTIILG
jgi:hypothetical protein